MQLHRLVMLLALGASAAPQATDELAAEPTGVVTVDGVQLDSAYITEPMFEIVASNSLPVGERTVHGSRYIHRRQAPPNPPTVTAGQAAKIKVPGGGKSGVFYRGDSRPPSEIFKSGFAPQGKDMNLQHHLSFVGDSGLVSLTRSPKAAEQYAFGRTGQKADKGYIYVIAPKDVREGYWVPGIYSPDKNPAVGRSQEFSTVGSVPGGGISHAYEVSQSNPSKRGQKIKNKAYSMKGLPQCSGLNRTVCDPANFVDDVPAAKGPKVPAGAPDIDEPALGKSKSKAPKSFRVNARAGAAVAFQALSPYAHDVLDLVKEWDNPIGHAIKWFDDSMASLQRAIGGEQVPEIYGNTLKLKIICWLRGERSNPSDVDKACQRLRDGNQGKTEQNQEKLRIQGINQILDACEKADQPDTSLPNEGFKTELADRCQVLRDQALAQDTGSEPPSA